MINWCITLYVIRILTPEDYGLMAMAMPFIAVLLPISELGLGAAIVQRKHIDETILRKTFGFILTVSCFTTAALALSAPTIANIFKSPELSSMLPALSAGLLIMAFGVLPRALMMRELDFRRLSMVDMTAALAGGLSALLVALSGHGVWALVVSYLVVVSVQTSGLICVSRFLPKPSFALKGIKDVMSFGSWMTGTNILFLLWSQLDALTIGRMLGKQTLGFYSVAKHISSLPLSKLQGTINNVAFPAYGMAKANKENPTYYLLKYLRISSLLSFPVFLGISAVATLFVPVFLGEKWSLSIVPLQVIAFVMPLRAAETAISPYLYAQGLVKTAFFNKGISLVLLVVSLIIGSRWGLSGVTYAWAIGYLLTFAVVLRRTCAVTSLRASRVTAIIFKMGTPACFMYASLFLIRKYALAESMEPTMALGTLVASGVVLYAAAAWVICRSEISELRGLARRPATS